MKRKIKLLFIAISICAMLFSFAISSSAWSNSNPGSSGSVDEDYWYIYDIHTCRYYGYAFTNSDLTGIEISLDYFGILNDGVIEHLNEEIASGSEVGIGLIHSSGWPDPDRGSKNNRFTREEVKLAFEQAYAEFESLLEKEFTQSDLDNAVTEATKDMYSQSQLDSAVAKALADAGLVMTSDTFIYILNDNIPDFLYVGGTAIFVWCNFENYSLGVVFYPDSSVEKPYIFIVDGARAYYEDITNNVEVKTDDNIFGYLCTKRESLDSYFYYDAEELYNEVASSLVEVPSADDLQAKYDEGKVAGATEYKSSEEYATALNNKYSAGYTEGIESYKASDEYSIILDNASANGVAEYKNSKEYATILNEKYLSGYSQGTIEGVTLYKSSDEYANILQGKFDDGYDSASEEASGIDWLGLAFGAFGIFVIFLIFFIGFKSSKKKRSRY